MIPFLLSPIGRWVAGVLAVSVVFGAWLTNRDHKQQAIGAEKVFVASKKEGAKANAKSQEHHSAANRPGSFDRLLKDSCSDC